MLPLFALSREGSLEGFRPRRILSRLCRCGSSDALFASVRRPRAEADSHFLSSFGNLQAFQHSNFQTFLRSIPFRIASFADPHHLTPIESHSCKKQGRGWGIRALNPTQPLPLFPTASQYLARSNTRNSNRFKCLLYGSLDTPGVGLLLLAGLPRTEGFYPVGRDGCARLYPYFVTSLLHCFFLSSSPLQSPRSIQEPTSPWGIDER